jgi:hypothetical protein
MKLLMSMLLVLGLASCAQNSELFNGVIELDRDKVSTGVDLLKRGAIAYVSIKSGDSTVDGLLTGADALAAFSEERNIPCYMISEINIRYVPAETLRDCGFVSVP